MKVDVRKSCGYLGEICMGVCLFLLFLGSFGINPVKLHWVYPILICSSCFFRLLSLPLDHRCWVVFLVWFVYSVMVFNLYSWRLNGDNYEQGHELYTQNDYQGAMDCYHKEVDSWYLIYPNHFEDNALRGMAMIHRHRGEFDDAFGIYKRIVEEYPRDAKPAQKQINKLAANLKYAREVLASGPDYSKLYKIGRLYEYEIQCHTKAIEVYRKIIEMDIRNDLKDRAREHVEKLLVKG